MADQFTTFVPGTRRVCVVVRSQHGEFYRRYVYIPVLTPCSDAEMIAKARNAFRRIYGDKPSIVSFDVNCPQIREKRRVRH